MSRSPEQVQLKWKRVFGKEMSFQRVESKAVLDIPITEARGYQGSRTVMIKVLLNKLCLSPTSARWGRQQGQRKHVKLKEIVSSGILLWYSK